MSTFHALFGVGGVAGALVASGFMARGIGSLSHVIAVTVLMLTALVAVVPRFSRTSAAERPAGPVFTRPPTALLSLGLLTVCGLLVEGAIGDWSAVYLRDHVEATASLAAAGFAAFSLMMAAGRFCGSYLADRLGSRALLRASGALAAAGLTAALLQATPWAALVSFGLVGLGVANVIPVLFSAAGRVSRIPAGVRRDHGGAGGARADEQVEPEGQDRALHIEVVRLAGGVAQRKVAEDEARYGAVLDDIARAAEQNGRDAVGFQVPRGQTHGLVANGSDRGEDRHVHSVLSHLPQDLRRIDGPRLAINDPGRLSPA